jgi:hypothetical protein
MKYLSYDSIPINKEFIEPYMSLIFVIKLTLIILDGSDMIPSCILQL